MTRALAGLVAAAALASVGLRASGQGVTQPSTAAQQQPTFRSEVNLVHVDAYPRRDGRVVEGLTASDFQVFEDGKPQTVEHLQFIRVEPHEPDAERKDPNTAEEGLAQAADPANRVFVVYLDSYHVNENAGMNTRIPLVNMLDRMMAPNDLFGVLTPQQSVGELVLARKLVTLDKMLEENYWWGQGDSLRLDPEEVQFEKCFAGPQYAKYVDELINRRREDIVLQSLLNLVPYLGHIRQERKVLVVFTSGWTLFTPDNALTQMTAQFVTQPFKPIVPIGSHPPDRQTEAEMQGAQIDPCVKEVARLAALDDQARYRTLIDLANRNNVTVYPVTPPFLDSPDAAGGSGGRNTIFVGPKEETLRTLASNTGGIAVVNGNAFNLDKALADVVQDQTGFYVLGYYSTNPAFDGAYRRIEVKVKQPGVSVIARHGYVAPTEAEMTLRANRPVASDESTEIASALGRLARLRPSADLYAYGVAGPHDMTIEVELPARTAATAAWANGATIQVMAMSETGESTGAGRGQIERASRGGLVRLEIPEGSAPPWKVRVQVKNDADTLEDTIDVKRDAATLVGPAVLYRGASRAPGNALLRPAADFSFRRSERVHVEWTITGALDNRIARLLDRSGKPLPFDVALTELPSGHVLVADFTAAPLGPGDYLLELAVDAGATHETILVPIRIAPG